MSEESGSVFVCDGLVEVVAVTPTSGIICGSHFLGYFVSEAHQFMIRQILKHEAAPC
jgi:hypothetical protein